MKTNIIVKLVLLILVSITLNGCYGGRYYRQPRITEEYGRQTETVTDYNGRKSTRVVEQEYMRKDPPPENRYYGNRYYNDSGYYNDRPNYSRRIGRNVIRLCLFGNC